MIDIHKIIPIKISFEKDLEIHSSKLTKAIQNIKCLIVGGAGTIGSNYIKQIIKFKPSKIVVVDYNENGLTELTRDLRSSSLLDYKPDYITYPVDLLSTSFDKIFDLDDFDLVANFAAHKHVRSEKDKISVEALIKNNVYGAIKLLDLCSKNPPKYFFSVSTDKATRPVNIMGASKSLMEKLIISKKNEFRVSTARFANVAFSNGSLLDGFINRIKKKQPLSCPEDIKRFFVTPKQSGQICLLSTFLGKTGYIFYPKLDFHNDQIYFKKIALDFLKNNEFDPIRVKSEKEAKKFKIDLKSKKYPIYFFKTNTSGEKKYEEFYSQKEDYYNNDFNYLGYIKSKDQFISFESVLKEFDLIFKNNFSEKSDIISLLKKYVEDFCHIETGKNLDQKM